MTNYYIQDNDKIVLNDTDKQRLINTLDFTPQYKGLEILETENIIVDGVIMTQEEYEQMQTTERENKFNSGFFFTSLGFVRRKVTMKDNSTKDFLTDILPLLQVGIPVITYNAPDFTTDEQPTQNVGMIVTEQFLNECKQQLLHDFYGAIAEPVENIDNN